MEAITVMYKIYFSVTNTIFLSVVCPFYVYLNISNEAGCEYKQWLEIQPKIIVFIVPFTF